MQAILGGLLLIGTLSRAEAAKAEASPPVDVWQKQFGANLHLSLGGPFGWAGGSLEYAPTRWLSLEAGGGRGWTGMQWAFEPRLRLPITLRGGGIGIGLGGGISGGAYNAEWFRFFSDTPQRIWDAAVWANLTASIEFRFASGFQLRFYGGRGWMLNPDSSRCIGGSCRTDSPSTGYFGVALGWSF